MELNRVLMNALKLLTGIKLRNTKNPNIFCIHRYGLLNGIYLSIDLDKFYTIRDSNYKEIKVDIGFLLETYKCFAL